MSAVPLSFFKQKIFHEIRSQRISSHIKIINGMFIKETHDIQHTIGYVLPVNIRPA